MKKITFNDLAEMPWKNGQGSTLIFLTFNGASVLQLSMTLVHFQILIMSQEA